MTLKELEDLLPVAAVHLFRSCVSVCVFVCSEQTIARTARGGERVRERGNTLCASVSA